MFHKEHSDKKNTFVNNIKLDKVDKKKESKTEVRGGHATPTRSAPKGRFAPPHVNTKISAYDRIVQLVTTDNVEVKPPQEESGGIARQTAPTERGTASFVQKKRVHMSV